MVKVLCGDKIIANSEERKRLLDKFRTTRYKLSVIEMESAGICRAIYETPDKEGKKAPRFIMIKGIADYADIDKSDERQPEAARNAACFLRKFLDRFLDRHKEEYSLKEPWAGFGIIRACHRGDECNEKIYRKISNSRSLKVMALSAESLIRHSKTAIVTALTRNCEVKVLIAQEGSPIVTDVEKLEGRDTEEISTEIKHTKSRLREIVNAAKAKNPNDNKLAGSKPVVKVSLAQYESAFRGALIICDDSWAWYTPGLPPVRAMESVSFELKLVTGGLLQDCIKHFDAVWHLDTTIKKEINSNNVER